MKLASQEAIANRETSESTRNSWIENEPTLTEDSTNVFDELCNAAKEGDLEKTESLVNSFGAPINMVDNFQCNPLYYACLCGHYEVVKFLLENGAQCDPNTFTGERCLYGALNDKIRRLLRSYKFSKAINENQPYLQFLTDLHDEHPYHDLTFIISDLFDDSEFPVQRFVMAARSQYFREQLLGRWWNESKVKLSSKLVNATAFASVLQYLYTGQLVDINTDVLENMIFVSKHLHMPDLQTRCEELLQEGKTSKNALRAQDAKEMAKIRNDYEAFLETLFAFAAHVSQNDKDKHLYTVTQSWLEPDTDKIQDNTLPSAPEATFADVGILIDNIVFPCHKAFLCRTQFFDIMLEGTFSEADVQTSCIRYSQGRELHLPLVELHEVSAEAFGYVMEYLYTDRCTIPVEEAYDVLLAADMLMLDRLKSIAAIALTTPDEPILDIYDLTRTAISLNVDRLEQWCIRYFADHFDDYINQQRFHDLIRESAQSIAGRQETDSIPLIDDLRYFLGKKYCIFEEDMNPEGRVSEEYKDTWTELETLYNEKLEMLDNILESLGLEA
ncbi:POZ domain-containing protein [Lichtheimia hyalospora FSU 10163]|nr:POZ domain-containing protein [Lichtheimia hyalospora FSU 10163]